jgi:hypothetical protein
VLGRGWEGNTFSYVLRRVLNSINQAGIHTSSCSSGRWQGARSCLSGSLPLGKR